MKKQLLFIVWGILYAICLLLGLAPLQGAFGTVVMVLVSLGFFVPGAMLAYMGIRRSDRSLLRTIRILSLCSLGLTLAALIAGFFSVLAPEAVGNFLQILLSIVSVPMICSRYWILSLFLWACLLMSTFLKKRA